MRGMTVGLALTLVATGCASREEVTNARFTSGTVDFGIVVSDIEESAAFYREGLGLTEVGGFDVPAEMGGDSGLSNYKPFHVKRFSTIEGPRSTNVKLMEFPGTASREVDNTYIHSSLGISYITLYVADIDAAVARAKQAGAAPLMHGPIDLPEGFPEGVYLACVRDPDGNVIELVGPKRTE